MPGCTKRHKKQVLKMKLFNVSSVVITSLINGLTSDSFYFDEEDAAIQLIETLQHLSPMSSAFKYDQYGCHCFQRGLSSSAFTGKGPAMDSLDKACLKFHQCQRCLGIDNGKECNHNVRYGIERNEDLVTSQRTAKCTDEPGTCARNLCECTISFALAMEAVDSQWDLMISKYSMDQSFRAQCTGHGATGLVHGAQTEVTAAELAAAMAPAAIASPGSLSVTTVEEDFNEVQPVNVRARFVDMPQVNLKMTTSETEEGENIDFGRVYKTPETPIQSQMVNTKVSFTTQNELMMNNASETMMAAQSAAQNYQQQGGEATGEIDAPVGLVISRPPATVPTTTTVPTTPEAPREMCCGSYSDHRFPYWSLNRGCCNGKTFDSLSLKCCDGVIKSRHASC